MCQWHPRFHANVQNLEIDYSFELFRYIFRWHFWHCMQFKRITRQCVYIDVSNVLRTTWTRWFSSDARIDLADLEHLGLQTSRKVINLLWSTLIFNILKATSLSCRVVDLKVLNIHVVNVIPSMDIIYRVARQLENSRIKKFHYTVTNRKQWKVAGRRNSE